MGLAGGPNGAKALFKHKFPDAFRSFQALEQARDAVGVARKQTLVVVDGNVLVMQTPAAVDTFPGYVAVLAKQLHGAIKAGEHVVVVFDEPASLTRAKQEEYNFRTAPGNQPVQPHTPQTSICSWRKPSARIASVRPPLPSSPSHNHRQLPPGIRTQSRPKSRKLMGKMPTVILTTPKPPSKSHRL